ncbi:MAG: hypothetical protein ACM3ML_05465 [Micromonosporaceae bacterium]
MSSGWTPGPDDLSDDPEWADLAPGWVTPVDAPWPSAGAEARQAGLAQQTLVEHGPQISVEHGPQISVGHGRQISVENGRQALVEHGPPTLVEHGAQALVETRQQTLVEQKPAEHAANAEAPPLSGPYEQVMAERVIAGRVPSPPASSPGSGAFQVHHAHASPFSPGGATLMPLPGLVAPPHGPRPPQQPAARPRTRARRVMLWSGLAGAVAGTAAAATIVLYGPAAVRGQASPASRSRTHGTALPATVAGYTRTQEGSKETVTLGQPYVSAVHTGVYQRATAAQHGVAGLTSGMIRIDVGRIAGISPANAIAGIYDSFKNQVDQASEGQAVVGAMRTFPAGSRGGEVKCWNVTAPSATGSPDSTGASCLWTDNNTFGYLFAPGMRTSSLAKTLLAFRSVIETPAH